MKKWIGVSALVVLAVTAVAVGGYFTWLHTSPPLPATVDDAMALVKSPRFRRLSEAEREPYVVRMRELADAMTPDQREKGMDLMRDDPELRKEVQKVRSQAMGLRFQEFARADPDQRRAMLDEDIQKMEAGMAMMKGRRTEGGGGNKGPRPGGDNRRAERKKMFQDRIQNGDPQDQAYMGEYMKALMQRRRELGLPESPWHRPAKGK